MMSVTGETLSKNVPLSGALNNAKPERIPATNKRMNRSILIASFHDSI